MKTNCEKNLPTIQIGNLPQKKIVATLRGQRSKETGLSTVRGVDILGLQKGLHTTECQHLCQRFYQARAVKLACLKIKGEPQARQLEEIPDRIMGLTRESGETKHVSSGQRGGG